MSAPLDEIQGEQTFDLVIEAGHLERQYWRDLWSYRELLYFLAWRDILVRYKQTVLGVLWAVLRPVVTVVIFTAIFHRVAGMPSEGLPYPLLVFAAMLPWQIFSNALVEASGSLVVNSNLISKIYFPRLLVPASAVAVTLADFAINAVLFLGLLAWYRVVPGWQLLTLPLFMGLALMAAVGAGLWMAALNVTYRDFRYIVPFMVQVGLYVSPVGYTISKVPASWRPLYIVNPMVGVIDGFRWAVSAGRMPLDGWSVLASAISGALLVWGGIWFFRRTERSFADVI